MATDKGMQIFPEQKLVADALANLTIQAAERAVSERGSFAVALAGGSLIKLLNGLKGRNDIDWNTWHVFWVDERCVPHECVHSWGRDLSRKQTSSLLHNILSFYSPKFSLAETPRATSEVP